MALYNFEDDKGGSYDKIIPVEATYGEWYQAKEVDELVNKIKQFIKENIKRTDGDESDDYECGIDSGYEMCVEELEEILNEAKKE